MRGINVKMEGGTSDAPTEDYDARDDLVPTITMVTGFSFYGYIAEDYGAQAVRLTDIPFDEAASSSTRPARASRGP